MALVKSKTNWKEKTVAWTTVIWLPGMGASRDKLIGERARRAEAVGGGSHFTQAYISMWTRMHLPPYLKPFNDNPLHSWQNLKFSSWPSRPYMIQPLPIYSYISLGSLCSHHDGSLPLLQMQELFLHSISSEAAPAWNALSPCPFCLANSCSFIRFWLMYSCYKEDHTGHCLASFIVNNTCCCCC